MALNIHPAIQVIADSKCKNCDGINHKLGVCGEAVLLRMNAGRWLARGNMFKFEAAKKEYMRHTNG